MVSRYRARRRSWSRLGSAGSGQWHQGIGKGPAFIGRGMRRRGTGTAEETQIIRLSVEDQRAFAEAILNPPPLVPAMERATERYRRLVAASID
jgi:hypothetical protein